MSKLSVICGIILLNSVVLAVHSTKDDCPVGKYRCKNFPKKETKKHCIDVIAICDGKRDCPNGDDEMSSYCNEVSIEKNYDHYNPGKDYVHEADRYVKMDKKQVKRNVHPKNNTNDHGDRYWPNNGCGAGHYLCNGTLNICVKLDDICNKVQDCPQNDDEDRQLCKNWPKAQNIMTLDSSSEPEIVQDQSYNSETNHAGDGFMFQVDNLIVYNSDVRMFNQNSDNIEE